MRYRHGPGREPLQMPRRRRRQSKSHKVHEENQPEYYGLSAGIPARNTMSKCPHTQKQKSPYQSSTKKEIVTKKSRIYTGDAHCYLHHAVFWYGSDGFKVAANLFQAVRYIFIKQDSEIGSFRLGLSGIYPACYISEKA